MTSITDPRGFAEDTFGDAQLGDWRRTQRLVDAAAALASRPGSSIPAACENDSARIQGFYKLIRNDDVDPEAIQEAGFESAARAASDCHGDILLVQDTTSISPTHSLREELRSKAGSPAGYEVHTGLLVDAERGVPIGVLGQLIWSRAVPKSKRLMDVESKKWQRLDEQTHARGIEQQRLIRVADRESDFLDYIDFHHRTNGRFVLRAAQNRRLDESQESDYLWDAAQQAPIVGTRVISIEQRGGQKATLEQSAREARSRRQVVTILRATRVELKGTKLRPGIEINLVYVTSDDNELEWLLLTSEAICNRKDVERVVGHYEKRWLIEQLHKSWKTGCNIEERKMGSLENYRRIMAITMPIAVRLLRLQVLANLAEMLVPATEVLSKMEVEVLWHRIEGTPLPTQTPSCLWAYRAIAALAGWQDSKRTGRIGLDTIWRGIERLTMLVAGWHLAMDLKK